MEKLTTKITSKSIGNFLLGLLGLISAVLGIYAFIFQEKKLEVSYEILANTSVLDINANVSNLDITYNGSSLKSKNKSLRIINLRIKNTGNESILKSFYDENDPLGAYITNGRIIEKPELINTSNAYIKKNIKIKYDNFGKIAFSDIILEPNEFFSVKLLVLHKANLIPKLNSTGKIAGIKKIPIISLIQQDKEERSFWNITFGGNWIAQLLRAFTYTLLVTLLTILVVYSVSKIQTHKEKNKRKKLCYNFKKSSNYIYNKMDDAIFSRFINEENVNFLKYQDLLKDENRLNQKYNNWINKLKDIDIEEKIYSKYIYFKPDEHTIINELITDGYVIKDKNDKLIINHPMKETLDELIDFLLQSNYYKPDKISY